MPPKRKPLIRFLWWLHIRIYRLSGGRLGTRLLDMPVLLLFTTGTKSGHSRVHALSYVRAGDSYVVAASNGGASVHPGWRFNLLNNPIARIQVGREIMDVEAREAQGAERKKLWERFKEMDGAYRRYETRTDRLIPVIVLQPLKSAKPF